MLREEPAILDVAPSPKAFLVNVGLPRTGTTSFALAARSLGLRVLHSWNSAVFHGKRASEHTRDHWWRVHYRSVLSGQPGELTSFDALTDSPFYSRALQLRTAYPNATFVCTTRSADSWASSMIFGHLGAGGLYLPRLYGLHGPPYANSTDSRANLTRTFAIHARHECDAVNATRLDLRDGSEVMWRRLCASVPRALGIAQRAIATCEAQVRRGAPWPRSHIEVSKATGKGGASMPPRGASMPPQSHA